ADAGQQVGLAQGHADGLQGGEGGGADAGVGVLGGLLQGGGGGLCLRPQLLEGQGGPLADERVVVGQRLDEPADVGRVFADGLQGVLGGGADAGVAVLQGGAQGGDGGPGLRPQVLEGQRGALADERVVVGQRLDQGGDVRGVVGPGR